MEITKKLILSLTFACVTLAQSQSCYGRDDVVFGDTEVQGGTFKDDLALLEGDYAGNMTKYH